MNDNLDDIRQQMRGQKGERITLKMRYGRRGGTTQDGIIDGLYPEVFTVLVREHGYRRRYCFSYSEVLTHHVEIDPYPGSLLSLHPET